MFLLVIKYYLYTHISMQIGLFMTITFPSITYMLLIINPILICSP